MKLKPPQGGFFVMIQSITVIGCGWLGLPLVETLVSEGYNVNGTTTTPAKLVGIRAVGATPYLLDLSESIDPSHHETCLNVDLIICAVPPSASKNQDFQHDLQIKILLSEPPKTVKVIYISSTSVYPQDEGEYVESTHIDEKNTGNPVLLNAENAVFQHNKKNVVLRSGGLLGYNRIAGKYFSGKTASGRLQPVNYIHRDDVIGVILKIINQNQVSGVFNLVTPIDATREEVYSANSAKYGFSMCQFKDDGLHRKIRSERISKELQYEFNYPDPRQFE
jgi:nucleoside-diphosphate-sugar epimerase